MTEKLPVQTPLVDQFNRTISYLRLSITDRCNLRCLYCMPQEEAEEKTVVRTGTFLPHSELLSYEELLRVVKIASRLGMSKIRLTGGEPLVRKGLLEFIHHLFRVDGLEQVRLTTNGVLLEKYAKQLFTEGVRHLNISLDSLDRQKFRKITGADLFNQVWEGIQLAVELGFRIKLNVVAMRGVNDDEFLDFGRLAMNSPIQVRFIEFMPVGEKSSWEENRLIPADEIRTMLSPLGGFTACERARGEGPAQMFTVRSDNGSEGKIGFISPISHHFCDRCNRLRLTSEGMLRACLLNDVETDLKALLRQGADDREIEQAIRSTILEKPKGHRLQDEEERPKRGGACRGRMSRIGG